MKYTLCLLVCSLYLQGIAKSPTLGFFAHEGGGIALDSLQAWDARTACDIRIAHVFLPKDTWADINAGTWAFDYWTGWVNAKPGRRLAISLPMLVWGADLASGANGDYNAHFTALAQNIVQSGLENSIIRIGWEMNGNWYDWYMGDNQNTWNNWNEYWRQIVTSMRSVEGQHFKFDWAPNNTASIDVDWETFYPGDEYVDVIGIDVYDWMWDDCQSPQMDYWLNHKYMGDMVNGGSGQRVGLLGHARFAAEHNEMER